MCRTLYSVCGNILEINACTVWVNVGKRKLTANRSQYICIYIYIYMLFLLKLKNVSMHSLLACSASRRLEAGAVGELPVGVHLFFSGPLGVRSPGVAAEHRPIRLNLLPRGNQ